MVEGVDALHRVDMWMEACTLFVELNEGPPGGTGAFFYALYSLQSVLGLVFEPQNTRARCAHGCAIHTETVTETGRTR